jgi:Family of unknown function (DUF6209)
MRYVSALALPFLLACSGRASENVAQTQASELSVPAALLTFTSSWTESATGLVAGETASISYDPARLPTCRGNLGYGGDDPGWSIDGNYAVNGIVFNDPIGLAGESLGNEHLPRGTLPSFQLPFAGTLAMWFENTDAFGCSAWDSNYGNNYAFSIAAPPNAPGWLGNASVLLDRAGCNGPCYGDAEPLGTGATFGTWARQQAVVTQVFFDVWQSGVTDFDNPELWQELDVEAHERWDGSTGFTMSYVNFAERTGNNARYAIDLRALDPLGGVNGGALTDTSQCPTQPITITADGQYVQADLELYFTANGVAVQPAGGGAFHVLYQNYAGLYAVCGYPT